MAMVHLGQLHERRRDLSTAEDWYRRAANGRAGLALYLLGRLYCKQKSYAAARQVFSTAATDGYAPAMNFLGRLYASGKGGERDLNKAKELFRSAIRQRNVMAMGTLGYILIQNPTTRSELLQGLMLYWRAWLCVAYVAIVEGKQSERLM